MAVMGRRAGCVTGVVLAATMVLAGCSDADPEPAAELTPVQTTEPSPEPSETSIDPAQLKKDNIAAAEQVVVDYWAAVDDAGRDPGKGWREVSQYMGSDLWLSYGPQFEANAEAGVRTEGDVEVASSTVTDYQPSESGLERVVIDACIDISGRKVFDDSGESIEPEIPDRSVTQYVVAHNGDEGTWVIHEMTPRAEEQC